MLASHHLNLIQCSCYRLQNSKHSMRDVSINYRRTMEQSVWLTNFIALNFRRCKTNLPFIKTVSRCCLCHLIVNNVLHFSQSEIIPPASIFFRSVAVGSFESLSRNLSPSFRGLSLIGSKFSLPSHFPSLSQQTESLLRPIIFRLEKKII